MDISPIYQPVSLHATDNLHWQGDWLVVPVPVDERAPEKPGKKIGEVTVAMVNGGLKELRVSLGSRKKMDAGSYLWAGMSASKWLVERHVPVAGVRPGDFGGDPRTLRLFLDGLRLGGFRFERYRSTPNPATVEIHLLVDGDPAEYGEMLHQAEITTGAANLTRTIAGEPPNVVNPLTLAELARKIAAERGLRCTVLGERELSEMGAGAIQAVGLGSRTPSQMIILEYPGKGAAASQPPIVIVGKALTFDTGGYSLKIQGGMVGMKFDKCGGAAVLGVMHAVSELELSTPVVGMIAAAENMISAEAYRPNDIIKTLSGKTVEVISADAEGRLVLSDTLTYAHTHFQPRAIIDLATLTGGVVVALGTVRAGIMSNNPGLEQALVAAGERTHERLWSLPLDDDYFELIRGVDSDIVNSSPLRQAHPVVGGIFLKQFVPDNVPWAHIDIAGVATFDKEYRWGYIGATGFGVRLVLDYLQSLE